MYPFFMHHDCPQRVSFTIPGSDSCLTFHTGITPLLPSSSQAQMSSIVTLGVPISLVGKEKVGFAREAIHKVKSCSCEGRGPALTPTPRAPGAAVWAGRGRLPGPRQPRLQALSSAPGARLPAAARHLADARRRRRAVALGSGGGGGGGRGAPMGATEKGGQKSRKLFSLRRPWKATRRLWRPRSARQAGQEVQDNKTCLGVRNGLMFPSLSALQYVYLQALFNKEIIWIMALRHTAKVIEIRTARENHVR
ncbi:PREDICTED: uncharacterized protein LOC105596064 [Cercocebus atys]|uniref:uncharacterized protein LOC105596064 n=1 Tax=Cercocebus atys TaxID=9531 RepID=UPI0005F3BDF9|nr:PREDICTED: uncharacterized protein LOC105596064 [Cercocebus atys]